MFLLMRLSRRRTSRPRLALVDVVVVLPLLLLLLLDPLALQWWTLTRLLLPLLLAVRSRPSTLVRVRRGTPRSRRALVVSRMSAVLARRVAGNLSLLVLPKSRRSTILRE